MRLESYDKKTLFIIIIIVIVVIISFLLYMFSDSMRFKREYNVRFNNKFVYTDISSVLESDFTGVVFFCDKNNVWCKSYAKLLDSVSKNSDVKKIYYVPMSDVSTDSNEYKNLIKLLTGTLHLDDNGKEVLRVPYTLYLKNGKVIYYDSETSLTIDGDTPEDYWTDQEKKDFTNRFNDFIKGVY